MLWDAAVALRDQALSHLQSSNDGLRISVVKLLESLVLFHSLRSRLSENIPGLDVSLDRVPLAHPFLRVGLQRHDATKEYKGIYTISCSYAYSVEIQHNLIYHSVLHWA